MSFGIRRGAGAYTGKGFLVSTTENVGDGGQGADYCRVGLGFLVIF